MNLDIERNVKIFEPWETNGQSIMKTHIHTSNPPAESLDKLHVDIIRTVEERM